MNGQELFLAAGAIGTVVFFVGVVTHFLLLLLIDFQHSFLESIDIYDSNLHGILFGFLLGVGFVGIYNKWLGTREDTIEKLIKEDNDGLELMLLESLKKGIFLSFTLSNGKVYIGLVNSHFYSPYENDSFQIWPFYSGYRKKDSLIELNIDYSQVYAEYVEEDKMDELDQFSVTIKVREIISCSYFDRNVYEKFGMK